MDTLLFTSRVHRHCACRGMRGEREGGRGREREGEGGRGKEREGEGGGGGGRGRQYAFAHSNGTPVLHTVHVTSIVCMQSNAKVMAKKGRNNVRYGGCCIHMNSTCYTVTLASIVQCSYIVIVNQRLWHQALWVKLQAFDTWF